MYLQAHPTARRRVAGVSIWTGVVIGLAASVASVTLTTASLVERHEPKTVERVEPLGWSSGRDWCPSGA